MSLLDRVRALLGDDAVEIAGGADAVPRVAPASPDAVALLLGTAREEGWRVRLEGAGTWLPADAPADLALTTRRLDRVPAVEPQDLSATAEAGIGCDLLRQQLADRGTWLALDPPGLAGRTLGSVVATATAGPLRHGFGAVRDHILGVTFVTGDGRLVQSGGRVVKNVAGYDLTKLEAGGFGAFGVIVLVHLRLRALPRADQTFVLAGTREDLTQVAEDVAAAGLQPAALELMSPALARRDGWALAVRLAGSAALVAAEEAGLRGASGGRFTALRAEEAHGSGCGRRRASPPARSPSGPAASRTRAMSCSTCCSIRWVTNGCRRAPASERSAGPGTRPSTGCAGCAVRSPGSRCRSPWSAPPGRSAARWAISAPTARA